jgi:hypothetical protein
MMAPSEPPRAFGVAAGIADAVPAAARRESATSPTNANFNFMGFFLWHF